MNWRRGLLLAAIHLAVAVPLILWVEARDLRFSRPDPERKPVEMAAQTTDETKETALIMDPCGMIIDYPPQIRILHFDNYPALVVTGWQLDCAPNWSISKRLHVNYLWTAFRSELPVRTRIDWCFGSFIVIEWFFVGAFPLILTKRWWLEPGAFITVCTVIAFGIVAVPGIEELALLPLILAGFAWLWWFGLLLWIPAHRAWQSTVGGLRRLNN
jgi:hypothetical protein